MLIREEKVMERIPGSISSRSKAIDRIEINE